MKNIFKYFFFVSIILLPSCKQNDLQDQLTACQKELEEKNSALAAAAKQMEVVEQGAQLVHTVYLDIKDDVSSTDLAQLMTGIKALGEIPGVYNLKAGTFKDLGDKRALSDYEVALQMEFHDETAYQQYQQDSIHLAFKKNVGHLLAGPPVTHDFTRR